MKKILAISAPAGLALALAAGLSSPAVANNGASSDVEYCQAVASRDFPVGVCLALLETKDPVAFCKSASRAGLLQSYGYKNYGDCVSSLSHS